jgi:tetratricopeptide (TPR) repeat protein
VVQALKFGANAFNWIWDGLPPAERVVVAAMAEVNEELITQDKLIETLNSSGVRLVARELEVAPETLMDWEVLIASEDAYRFAVPLLRRWVILNRPLRRVKEELDRLNPLAENLYQSGQGFYSNNQLEPAEQQLRQALNINPNHLKARLLLGQILLEQHNLIESVDMYEAAYQYDERAARAYLIKSLLALAESQEENLQLSTYERIVKIQNDQPLANEKIRSIWVKRGEALQAQENFEEALKAFEQIGDTERIEKVRQLMHEKKLTLDMQRADAYEKAWQWKLALDTLIELTSEYPESETLQARVANARMHWRAERLKGLKVAEEQENWEKVLELCQTLGEDFPEDAEISSHAERARTQMEVMRKYQDALRALQSGQYDEARHILSGVLVENPRHLEAARKLIEATYGKVKILAPVPLLVQIAALVSTALWTIVFLFLASGLLTELVVAEAMKDEFPPYYLYSETFILIGVLLIPLVGVLLGSYTTSVIDSTYQVDRERPSYAKAFWAHMILGMGMFYVDPKAARRWLYLLLAVLVAVLVLSVIFYEATRAMSIGYFRMEQMLEGRVSDTLGWMLWLFLGLYLISFVDVMLTCSLRRKSYSDWKEDLPIEISDEINQDSKSPQRQKHAWQLAQIIAFLQGESEKYPGTSERENKL